ncbi:MAG: 16S rRNA (adenine(1518)-N(6)/adenine(1519)-N(6))-dimethyltransferase RsmA [Candidatus Aminicenantales bacterium]|jgi:16S rRNA (adenine1518-N6/adenine1519-N6)-dimethyltransferase
MKRSRRHALGQHFLASPAVLRKIVGVIGPRKEDVIVEIGAGRGVLTAALAERAGRVIAIEKDGRLIPGLREAMPANVEVIHGDALTIDFNELRRKAGVPALRVVGNIPYSISSPILRRVLDDRDLFTDCVFLLQKEVAARIPAGPGSKKYAPLSILLQNYFEARVVFTVAPGSFSPPPRVQSALLALRLRPAPLHAVTGEPLYRAFLQAAFAERRKQLRKNLERHADASALAVAFERCGLLPNVRAEQVPPETFAALFDALRQGAAPPPARSVQ